MIALDPFDDDDREAAAWVAAAIRRGCRDLERANGLRAPDRVRRVAEVFASVAAISDRSRQELPPLDGGEDPGSDALMVGASEAGRRLGLSARAVDRLRRTGAVPSVKVGGARRYRVADLEHFVANLEPETPT